MLSKLMVGRANEAITVFHWLNPKVSKRMFRDMMVSRISFLGLIDLSLKKKVLKLKRELDC